MTPPYGSTLAEAWVGGPSESTSAVLSLSAGVGLAAQDVALSEGARISGTVRGGSPLAAIPSATVDLRRAYGAG